MIDHEKLRAHIAQPDWEKRLLPLFLFKGSQPYRLRALWNIAYAMYLAECNSLGEGTRLIVPDDDHGKLCGILRPPSHMSVRGIFGRLRGCRALTESVGKAFTEYVEHLHPWPCVYEPVPLESKYPHRMGWWRVAAKHKRTPFRLPDAIKSSERQYPYVQSKTPEQQLVTDIYAMVPKSIPQEIRGDLCQDLIVAVLSGETSIDNIPNVLHKYAVKARKIMPDRFKHVSIDACMPGTDDKHFVDTLERCTDDFAPELIERISEAEEAHGVPIVEWDAYAVGH